MGLLCLLLGHEDSVYVGPSTVNIKENGWMSERTIHADVPEGSQLKMCRRCRRAVWSPKKENGPETKVV